LIEIVLVLFNGNMNTSPGSNKIVSNKEMANETIQALSKIIVTQGEDEVIL